MTDTTYEVHKNMTGETIFRVADNAWIPTDEGNCDYQAYLRWVAEGNTALPPDPPPEPVA